VLFAAQLLTSMGFSTIFPFLPQFVEHLGSSTGLPILLLVTAVFSGQALAMMIASPVWGALADRFGRKRMVERALYSGAVLIALMAFVRSAEELVALRVIQGLTTGVVAATTSMVASVVPRDRLGYAMGVMQTALWSGVSVGPVIGGVLEYAFGYRAAFAITAGLLLVGGLLVTTLVRERFVPPPRGRGGVRGFTAGLAAVVAAPSVTTIFAVRFLAWSGRTMIVPFLPLFVAALMAGSAAAGIVTGLAIGASSLAGTLTSIALGRLGDRVGHRRVLLSGAVVTALLYLPLSQVQGAWQLVVLYALTGAAIGGVLPSLSALLAQRTDASRAGAVYGLDNAVGAGARALSPMIGGGLVALIAGTGTAPDGDGYRVVFLAAAALFAAAAALVAWRLPGGAGGAVGLAASPGVPFGAERDPRT
jgi:MFS transporter, DHA1 family, multidrug resistance protein